MRSNELRIAKVSNFAAFLVYELFRHYYAAVAERLDASGDARYGAPGRFA